MKTLESVLATSLLVCATATAAQAAPIDYVITYVNAFSVDAYGDALNTRDTHLLGANAHVIGIGWDVTIFADAPSLISEAVVSFESSSALEVQLTPGIGDDFSGTRSYTSGGVVDLVPIGLDFLLLADGLLITELFETFDDFVNDWDAMWNGMLTVRYEPEAAVPEPATYGLLAIGLAGVAARRRRRHQ